MSNDTYHIYNPEIHSMESHVAVIQEQFGIVEYCRPDVATRYTLDTAIGLIRLVAKKTAGVTRLEYRLVDQNHHNERGNDETSYRE